MRFKLYLRTTSSRPRIMWNYHYPLSFWLYGIIAKADENYADFLHNKGYELSNRKRFKHFTFSDLRCKIGKSDTKCYEMVFLWLFGRFLSILTKRLNPLL
jgi:CRISPR-associated endoribonuclease Cas6